MDSFPTTASEQTRVVLSEANLKVLNYIEATVLDIIHNLEHRPVRNPAIRFRRMINFVSGYENDGSNCETKDREVSYAYASRKKDETWRFTCLLRILIEIQTAVCRGVVVTKRDIFYRDPALFVRQSVVDRFIDDVAHTCEVARKDLNVVASPKGLITGLRKVLGNQEAELVPDVDVALEHQTLHQIRWILVIEKEATFKSLLEQNFHLNKRLGRGMLVTAKGYPDIATRRFVRKIQDHSDLKKSTYGLFDCDPYGIDILRCYCHTTRATVSEVNANVRGVKWLGVKFDVLCGTDAADSRLLIMKDSDRSKARGMLHGLRCFDGICQDEGEVEDWRIQLQRMLFCNRKAEIQLANEGSDLCDWLEEQIAIDME